MISPRKKMIERILWVGTLLCVTGFLFAVPCLAQKAPKGKVVTVVSDIFAMNGGDCHTATGGGSVTLGNLIHEGLVRINPDGRFVPALAKSWEVSKDGLSMKFTLNERAKFHNGEPVTAKDVKFSIERAMRPELKFRGGGDLRRNIDRIEIIDDHHLTVYLKSPFPGFFDYCANYLGIIPKAYAERVGDEEFAKHPIGAGPFKWIDYQQDVFVNAEAVENHYRKTPQVKSVRMVFCQEGATTMAMFKAGEADVATLPLDTFEEVQNNPKFRIVWSKFVYGPSLALYDVAFPNEPSPFHDVRVRRAASYAINRKAICEKILHGAAEPWGDILAPYNPGCDPTIKPDPYDPEKAKALLKEAGYPNGFDTTMPFGLWGDKTQSEAMAADLARVGIRAKLVQMETGAFVSAWREKKLRGLGRSTNPGWLGMINPASAVDSTVSSAAVYCYQTTPEADDAWKKLCELTDQKAIAAQAKEMSRIFREAELRYMLWAIHQPFGLSPKVKSYKPLPGRLGIIGLEYLELKD